MHPLLLLLAAPLLTATIELSVWKGLQLSFRKLYGRPYIWLAIIAINLLTNPLLQIAMMTLDPARTYILLELSLEAIIIVAEWRILKGIYGERNLEWLELSAAMNVTSYAVGLALFTPAWL